MTLESVRPQVWRRLRVVSSCSLEELHRTLQIVMGWSDEHLHQFIKDGECYGVKSDEFASHMVDQRGYRLEQLLKFENDFMVYEYDFGDGWIHKIELEQILTYNIGLILPICLRGSRACPPEDIGGAGDYQTFQGIMQNSRHPRYQEVFEWYGRRFDPDYFNVAETNDFLRESFL